MPACALCSWAPGNLPSLPVCNTSSVLIADTLWDTTQLPPGRSDGPQRHCNTRFTALQCRAVYLSCIQCLWGPALLVQGLILQRDFDISLPLVDSWSIAWPMPVGHQTHFTVRAWGSPIPRWSPPPFTEGLDLMVYIGLLMFFHFSSHFSLLVKLPWLSPFLFHTFSSSLFIFHVIWSYEEIWKKQKLGVCSGKVCTVERLEFQGTWFYPFLAFDVFHTSVTCR